tara:strand:- start:18263 stop:18448 length:186 start_codon:yes stop_codon:yes gene_type:complete
MSNKTIDSLEGLQILVDLIQQMEEKQENHPEYIIKNIELVDKVISILNDFKNNLIKKLPTS